jgi:cation:H+ antiporter
VGAASVGLPIFVVAAAASLTASWILASRLERVGSRFGITDALLGVVAALAADSPEVTSAVTALARHQSTVGSGVVLGSNVFNLAALLGVSALVAGSIRLHRRVVLLSGFVAVWISGVSVVVIRGEAPAALGLGLVCVALVPYLVVLGTRRERLARLPLPRNCSRWLVVAISEEEGELSEPHPRDVSVRHDLSTAGLALVVVVVASVVMERAVTAMGARYAISEVVTGALVLAAVTSLPNAVTAVYLAVRGRGPAVLSTALNSNAINVALGWLLPATALAGAVTASARGQLAAFFYAGLTVLALGWAYRMRGLGRTSAVVIILTYLAFVASLLAVSV